MPRASWKGFLRLSLVSCPVYLSPATTRTKSIRLHQVWLPRDDRGRAPDLDDDDDPAPEMSRRRERVHAQPAADDAEWPEPAARVALRPHDPGSGAEIAREQVRKGFEYDRGRFVTFTPEELKALDIESSKTIDLQTFVSRAEIDPLYFNAPYYIYPDGAAGIEPYRVIGAAMAEAGIAGLARLTLSRRERMVMIEPRGEGMLLFTLRSSNEVRRAEFDRFGGELDPEAIAIATMIIQRNTGTFDPTAFRDRYQERLREMIDAKLRGLPIRMRPATQPPPVIDLMAMLKASLGREPDQARKTKTKRRAAGDRRQRNLLLPVTGSRVGNRAQPTAAASGSRRRKA